jgi:4-hydroxy-2-oxoheptanedioate aldolase
MSYGSIDPTVARAPRSGPGLSGTGLGCSDADARAVRRFARTGVDWVGLDLQHGRYDRAELVEIARAWRPDDAALVVRAPAVDAAAIGLVLDVSASVIVPQVESAAHARAVVEAAYYPPRGRRSFGPLTPAWGVPATPAAEANATVDVAVMIESAEALAAVDAIAAVEGVGCLFVGPYDLALSLGRPVADVLADRSPEAPLPRIVAAAHARGLRAGIFAGDPALARSLADLGLDAVATVTDAWILSAGIRAALAG